MTNMRLTFAISAALLLMAAPAGAQRGKADTAKGAKAPPPAGSKAPATQQAATPDTSHPAPPATPTRPQMSILREEFMYSSKGRRDPMLSLLNSPDVRPMFTEVELLGVVYDEEGTNSVATLRNTTDKKTIYRVKVGQVLGRMRIAQITRNEVVFTIEEFGFSRQQRLAVKPDTTRARTP